MMPSIGGFSISVTANTAGLNKGFKKARGLTRGFAGGIGKLAGGMAAIGAPLAGIAGIAKLIRVGSEFQSEMSNVKAFVKGTESELQKLSDTAEGLGASTAFTASDAAKAMAEMGKAGLSANQILGASEGVLTLAAAGDIEMAEAATIAAASLNQFGIPASEMGSVVDQLAKAASSGSISLSGMGTQLSYAAASATKAGMDISETSAIVASLATTMGEQKAGTGFRAMMNSITAPTAAATAEMDRLGIKVLDANKKFLSFPQMIENFNSALSGMPQGDRAASLGKMFTTIGDPAISKMLKLNGDGIRSITESVADSDGFGLAVADEKLDNVAGGFKRLQSAVMAMSIDIFQTFEGPLQSALEGTASFVTDTMIPGWKTMMEWVSAFAKVAEFAWTSFGALAGLATLKALSAVTTLSEDIQHFFGTNMAEVFNWLFSNWSSIWVDMAAVTFGVLDNIGQNVRNVFSAVWETVTSLGETPLTFDMVPLMDGVQTVTAGLELTERAMTADERDYQREIAEVGNAIGQDFDDFLTSTVDGIGSTTAAADDVMDDVANADFNADFNADKSAVATKDGDSPLGVALRGSKEAFDVINKAIRGEKDAYQKTIAKEAEKQTKLAEQQVALLEDNNSIEPAAVMSIP